VCVYMWVCTRVCACACVCVCVSACAPLDGDCFIQLLGPIGVYIQVGHIS